MDAMDPQFVVDKCHGLRVRLEATTVGEPLNGLAVSLETLSGLLCSLHGGSASIETVLGAVSNVQGQLANAVRSLARAQQLTAEVLGITEDLAVICCRQQQLLDEYQFLAEWRDYASLFGVLLARNLNKELVVPSWEILAAELWLEEGLPEAQQPTTSASKAALAKMGLSWQEWQQLREVSDAGIAIMHSGKPAVGIAMALAQIDTMAMPPTLSHTRGALKKVLQCVRDAAPAPFITGGRQVRNKPRYSVFNRHAYRLLYLQSFNLVGHR